MKTIHISYKTNTGDWLCDINLLGKDICKAVTDTQWFMWHISLVLYERYEGALEWSFVKWYV